MPLDCNVVGYRFVFGSSSSVTPSLPATSHTIHASASTKDILPTLAASGQWASIRSGHQLIKLQDGKVLDWEPSSGKWRLWNYVSP